MEGEGVWGNEEGVEGNGVETDKEEAGKDLPESTPTGEVTLCS